MMKYNNFAVEPETYKKLTEIIKVTNFTKIMQFKLLVEQEYTRLGLDKEELKDV